MAAAAIGPGNIAMTRDHAVGAVAPCARHRPVLPAAAAAFAQDAAADPAATAGKPDAAAVPDQIQVTAQRRVENIQDVPVSVSTVSGEKLDVLNRAAPTCASCPRAW